MTSHDQLERVIRKLHEAALGDVAWKVPACMFNEVIRVDGNTLVMGQGHSRADLDISFIESCYGDECRTDYDQRYFKQYYTRDERIPRILSLPKGQLIPTDDLYTEREKRISPAYNKKWRQSKKGFHVRLDGSDGSHVVWILAGSTRRGGGWSSTQTEMIRSLLPHIRHFARVREALAYASAVCSSLEELLENGRFGVIQLDRHGRILAANDRARSILAQDGGLSDRGGFLGAPTIGENDELKRLLSCALPSLGVLPSAGSMTIGHPADRTRLVVHITPVAGREWDLNAQRVGALVLVVNPETQPQLDAGLVAKALHLTPAEGQLATMLAAGRTVRQIAAATGRTEGTVRWHLKQVFRKQGVSRQADLVRRVLWLNGIP